MARVLLTADEKKQARALLDAMWKPEQVTIGSVTAAADPLQVNPREAYITLLHLDTLDALHELDFLVFKGGTCVQTFLPPARQRISVDLDFNSRYAHPNTVESAIVNLNTQLVKDGRAATIHGIEYGKLLPDGHNAPTGTVNFARYLPTPWDERAVRDGVEFQARLVRVQINIKHHELPAIDPKKRKIEFFTQPALKSTRDVKVESASAADLVADKILAITKNVGGFGRERIKDFYDLFAMGDLKVPRELVVDKLDRVAAKVNATRAQVLDGAVERCEDVRANHLVVQSYVSSVCKDGKKLLANWETELDKLQDRLRALK